MLIIFSGLPGTGKTTIATQLARKLLATYLRIDSLEISLVRSGLVKDQWNLGSAGYFVAYTLALDNLQNGVTVIADSVNPLSITRNAWRSIALQVDMPFLEIEVICSDTIEHRRRVESRKNDISGLQIPTWEQVMTREYEPWDRNRLILDTAVLSISEATTTILKAVPFCST